MSASIVWSKPSDTCHDRDWASFETHPDADPTRPQHDYWCSLPERRCCGWFLQRAPGGPVEASAYARRVNPSGTGQHELKGGYQVFETIEQAKGWIVETAQGFAGWRWNARGDLIAPE